MQAKQAEFGEYYDISPVISSELAVFPGDTAYRRKVALDFHKGDHLGLSAIHSTVHLGAHVDAPNHYHPSGVGIEARKLDYYFGPCQVISVGVSRGKRISPKDLNGTSVTEKRVLFKTRSFPNPNQWNEDFSALSAELVDWLAKKGVFLVGIDTPSVDLANDKLLESHQAVFQADMAILEGIELESVPDGVYTLVALPLRLKDADASPVRAILVKPGRGQS